MSLRRKVRPAGAAARRASLRWWLLNLAATGATLTAAAALLAVSLHVSTTSALAGAHYRLSQPREAEELLRWEQEFAPPQLASPQSRKLDGAADDAVEKRLSLPPPLQWFVPCVVPSSEYRRPSASRGYLLVHTNGGLNQMRAGVCLTGVFGCRLRRHNPPTVSRSCRNCVTCFGRRRLGELRQQSMFGTNCARI